MYRKIKLTLIHYLINHQFLRNVFFTKSNLDAYDAMIDLEGIWPLPRQQIIDDATWHREKAPTSPARKPSKPPFPWKTKAYSMVEEPLLWEHTEALFRKGASK